MDNALDSALKALIPIWHYPSMPPQSEIMKEVDKINSFYRSKKTIITFGSKMTGLEPTYFSDFERLVSHSKQS